MNVVGDFMFLFDGEKQSIIKYTILPDVKQQKLFYLWQLHPLLCMDPNKYALSEFTLLATVKG